jgi:hypothetical protein
MNPPVDLTSFDETIKQLAEAVYLQVESGLLGAPWTYATLDVRYARNGSSWLSKIRVSTSANPSASIDMSNEIDLLLITLSGMRATIFENEWFGLKLGIDADRRCKISLNYDANCSNDKAFFDS